MKHRVRRVLFLSSFAIAFAGCTSEAPPTTLELRPEVTLGTFAGTFDASTRTLTIAPLPAGSPAGALVSGSAGGFVAANVVQDGTPLSGPPESIELRTLSAEIVAGGCGAQDAFEGDVQINSFYTATALHRPHVEITALSAPGFESCESAASPDPGISNALGLVAYGEIAPGGTATARWNFALPSTMSFTFTGRVVAQLVERAKPVTSISPLGGDFGTAAPEITLTCDDGTGSGCAAIFYRFQGGEKRLYTGPFRLYASMSLCYFSVDHADNVEAEKCQSYSTYTARLATWDPILQVPTCWEPGVSCDSNLLSEGRGSLFGYPEPPGHGPSTINDSCADGEEAGSYGPELDNVRIYATDGGPLRSGALARVDARVWRHSTGATLEFNSFTAEDPASPAWVSFRNVQQNLGAVNYYNLTTSSRVLGWFGRGFGAMRGTWRPGINNSSFPCSTGIYDDFDDLVFAVEPTAGFLPPTVTLSVPAIGMGLVPLSVTTWDDAGVEAVEYQANGATIGISRTAPFGITWDANGFPSGAATIRAIVYDSDGNSAFNEKPITVL